MVKCTPLSSDLCRFLLLNSQCCRPVNHVVTLVPCSKNLDPPPKIDLQSSLFGSTYGFDIKSRQLGGGGGGGGGYMTICETVNRYKSSGHLRKFT